MTGAIRSHLIFLDKPTEPPSGYRPPRNCWKWPDLPGRQRPNWDSRSRTYPESQNIQNETEGRRPARLLPSAFPFPFIPQADAPIEDSSCLRIALKLILHAVQEQSPLLDWPRRLHAQKGKDGQSQNPGQKDDRQKKQPLVVLVVIFIAGKEFMGIVNVVEI